MVGQVLGCKNGSVGDAFDIKHGPFCLFNLIAILTKKSDRDIRQNEFTYTPRNAYTDVHKSMPMLTAEIS